MQPKGRREQQADTPPSPAAAPPRGTALPSEAAPAPASAAALAAHWRRTCWLTAVLLLVWFLAGFVGVYFAADLRQRFFGWPLGFWMASQGALLVFLAVVVVYAWAMGRLDDAAGLAEEP